MLLAGNFVNHHVLQPWLSDPRHEHMRLRPQGWGRCHHASMPGDRYTLRRPVDCLGLQNYRNFKPCGGAGVMDMRSIGEGRVLLLGGPSGVGKSTAAKDLSRKLGIGWVQVDDLRLALQWSGARLPTDAATDALRFFEQSVGIWSLPPEYLRDQLLAVGSALADAIAIVVANHIVQGDSAIIEGDAILPSLLHHPILGSHAATGNLKMAFVLPGSEAELRQSIADRGRDPIEKIEGASRMNWLFAGWLRDEVSESAIVMLDSQPQRTLVQRIQDCWYETGSPVVCK
jgi:hypothetical protein